MSINTFKKIIMVISFAVIAISANAQNREDKESFVSTWMRANTSESRVLDDAQGDSSYSGLAKVAFDQLVTQPCQAVLSTTAAFCKFSYQHPATALAMTATFALPVVAALVPEQSSTLWYPSFVCAKKADVQQMTYVVNSVSVTNNFVTSDGGYDFQPYNGTIGYATDSACSYASWSSWLYKMTPACQYTDSKCTQYIGYPCNGGATGSYLIAQPEYTMSLSEQQSPLVTITALCVQDTPTP